MSNNIKDFTTEDLIKELESRGYKTTKKAEKKTTSTNADNKELFNPIFIYRDNGEETLKEKLEQTELEDLIKMIKAHIPDMGRTIYRQKNKDKVIDYIIQRASKASKFGQCFRTCTDDTKLKG